MVNKYICFELILAVSLLHWDNCKGYRGAEFKSAIQLSKRYKNKAMDYISDSLISLDANIRI